MFSIGKSAQVAVKATVSTEDVAATVWLALQIGTPQDIVQEDVDKLHQRYHPVYGQ